MENVVTENATVETATPVVANQETATSTESQTTEGTNGVTVSGDAAVTPTKRTRKPAAPKAEKVVKMRKDGTVDLRTGNRKVADAEAPYGRKADGTPRQAPGRRKAPAAQ